MLSQQKEILEFLIQDLINSQNEYSNEKIRIEETIRIEEAKKLEIAAQEAL